MKIFDRRDILTDEYILPNKNKLVFDIEIEIHFSHVKMDPKYFESKSRQSTQRHQKSNELP